MERYVSQLDQNFAVPTFAPQRGSVTFARYPGYSDFHLADDPAKFPQHEILDVIVGDHLESRYEAIGVAQGCPPTGSGYGWSNPPTVLTGERTHVFRSAQFLMGRHSDAVLEGVRAELLTSKALVVDQEKTVVQLKKEIDALKKFGAQIEVEFSKRTEAEMSATIYKKVANKLEGDVAKLKRVLGEKAVADALVGT